MIGTIKRNLVTEDQYKGDLVGDWCAAIRKIEETKVFAGISY